MAEIGPDPTVQNRISEMRRPQLYGRKAGRVRLIQTHTSWVFIAGDYAYKVKKPVNFGFLDYTTLAARKFFCNEEFRLNRLLSPEMYEAVLPITDRFGRLHLGGQGQPIDYCIKMKAFPQSALMTHLLQEHKVTFEHIDAIASKIADFHSRSEHGREVSQFGSSETIRLNWDENFAQTIEFCGLTISRPAFDEIREQIDRFIVASRRLFRRRREEGRVRRCHGDLHSRNVFIVDNRIFIFDCIEFNPRFSCSDTTSEIAFMCMDLEFHNRNDLASFFVERYLAYAGDEGMLPLLNFYQCYRAYVRGKVTSFRLREPSTPPEERLAVRRAARRYFALALRYAQMLSATPRLTVFFGLPGVGKTYVARRLATRIGGFHLLSDSIRKQLLGIPVGQHRFDGYGRGIYNPEISRQTYVEMFRRAELFLRAGHNVILDATFLNEDSRQQCRELARRLRVPALFVLAECPERTVRQRLRRRAHAYSFSDADLSIYKGMKARFRPPGNSKDLVRIDTRTPVSRSLARIERALLHC